MRAWPGCNKDDKFTMPAAEAELRAAARNTDLAQAACGGLKHAAFLFSRAKPAVGNPAGGLNRRNADDITFPTEKEFLFAS